MTNGRLFHLPLRETSKLPLLVPRHILHFPNQRHFTASSHPHCPGSTMGKATQNWDSVETWQRLVAAMIAAGCKVRQTPVSRRLISWPFTDSLPPFSPICVKQRDTSTPHTTRWRIVSANSRKTPPLSEKKWRPASAMDQLLQAERSLPLGRLASQRPRSSRRWRVSRSLLFLSLIRVQYTQNRFSCHERESHEDADQEERHQAGAAGAPGLCRHINEPGSREHGVLQRAFRC